LLQRSRIKPKTTSTGLDGTQHEEARLRRDTRRQFGEELLGECWWSLVHRALDKAEGGVKGFVEGNFPECTQGDAGAPLLEASCYGELDECRAKASAAMSGIHRQFPKM